MSILEERRKLITDEMEVGRGSAFIYDYPVSLEPPFKPFSFRTEKRSLLGSFFQQADKSRQILPDNSKHGRLSFIRIKPSHEDKYSLDIAEQFILSLPASIPVAFEIIGRGGRISFQIAAEEDQTPAIISQVSSHFPGADVYPEIDLLKDVLSTHAVVRAYRLKNTHFLSLNVNGNTDLYRTLFGCLGNLERERMGVFQILFAPVTQNWQDNMLRASRNQYDPSQSPFFDLPLLPRSVDKKIAKPLYTATIRMLASGETLIANMESFLRQADDGENGIVPVDGSYPARSILERNTYVHGSIINSTELAYFIHLPAPDILDSINSIEKAVKSYAVNDEFTLDGPVLGFNLHRGIRRVVCHPRNLPNQHGYISGESGQGKSNLILSIATQRINRNEGVAVVDPHGALIKDVLRRIPKERIDDVVYFNAGDFKYPMAINPLAHGGTKLEKEHIRVDLLDFFEDLFEAPLGVNIQHTLNFIIISLLTRRDSTLQDIERLLIDKSWRAKFLQSIEDDRIRMFWEQEYPLLERRGIIPAILNKLSPLTIPDSTIAPMLSQRENKVDFLEIMNGKKIFLCNLSHGDIGKRNSQLLGKLLVSKLQIAAMMREGLVNYPDYYVYIDEFQHMACPSMSDALSGARKYKLHLWLANQMTEDIPDKILRHVFNASTLIFFATDSPHDQTLIEKTLSKRFKAEDIGQLKKGEALVKMVGNAFNMTTERVPEPPSVNWVDEIIAASRRKYTAGIVSSPNQENKYEKAAAAEITPRVTPRRSSGSSRALSFQEKAFLECVYHNPALSVTNLYKDQHLSAYMGDKLKTVLKDKGLLLEVSTRLGLGSRVAKFVLLTPKGFAAIGSDFDADSGKGGPLHRYWQSVIQFHAEGEGYRAVIEEQIPDSLEAVDVGLVLDGTRFAVEVSVTTNLNQEINNIRKCLQAGYDKVIVLFLEENKTGEFQDLTRKVLTDEERSRISVGLVYDFCRFL
ncbi:MAG: type IV secretory system conjugative DNA transfer family protein [Nitrospirota bacterium]